MVGRVAKRRQTVLQKLPHRIRHRAVKAAGLGKRGRNRHILCHQPQIKPRIIGLGDDIAGDLRLGGVVATG